MTHEARGNPEQDTQTRRDRIRDFFFRLRLTGFNSRGEERRSFIDVLEGDPTPARVVHQRIMRSPYPQAQLEAMAQREATSETELQQQLERIERVGERHEQRRRELLTEETPSQIQ